MEACQACRSLPAGLQHKQLPLLDGRKDHCGETVNSTISARRNVLLPVVPVRHDHLRPGPVGGARFDETPVRTAPHSGNP
jgi:hypothetical protein